MKTFEKYFATLYLLARINEANFVRFLEDHLQRLIANNAGGKYTPLITALTALLIEYKTTIDTRNLNQALQESRTKSVDQSITSFRTLLSNKLYEITDIWDEDNAVFEEFIPHGMDEYYQAKKGNIGGLMNRFISACDLHRNDLPAGFTVPFVSAKDGYIANRTAQLALIATVDSNRVDVAIKRGALSLQVTKNLLTLGLEHLGRPEMAAVFFDQSIIRRPVKQNGVEPEPEILSEAVAPQTKAMIMHGGFDANTLLHIVNTGSVNLKFYTANMIEDPVSGNAIELAPGEEDEVLASELGADSNLFLMAANEHATLAGSYAVNVVEME
jgi:hypothetical protein